MGVLVTLTGAAPGCGYDNPGFKLKDSDPITSGGAETTSVSGVTMATSETGIMTTPPTTSTADVSTSNGSQVSGSESTETTEDPTTSTLSTTTGMPIVEWPPCILEETKASKAKLAAADTFLLTETPAGQTDCAIEPPAMGQCRDLNLGATNYFELHFEGGDPMDPKDDTASVFAVRFDAPDPPMHEDLMVPPDSVIGVRVTIHLARPFPKNDWAEVTFNVFGLQAEMPWPEGGGFGPTPCESPGASFRCSQCKTGEICLKPWIGTYPYPTDLNMKVASFTLIDEPPVDIGIDVELDFPIEALDWLTENGLVVVPETGTKKGTIEVKARDYDGGALGPNIQYLYCPPLIP